MTKTIFKAMLTLCIICNFLVISAVDKTEHAIYLVLFFTIVGLLFNEGIKAENKLIELNNDLYEHSNY